MSAGKNENQCPKGGDHEWEIEDYCDDDRDGVMRGPVCRKCGAIGEHVLGTRVAGLMTVQDLYQEIADLRQGIASES